MPKPLLTVILAHPDLAAQAAHLARGALYLPEPEPLPEPSTDITLRVETAAGKGVELDARVLQILPGHGIVVSFDDMAGAKKKLAPIFAEPASAGDDEGATFIFWGRGRPVSARPVAVALPPVEPDDSSVTEPHVRIVDEPQAGSAEIDLDETAKMEAEIAAMNTNQKMQLAMRGTRVARTLLMKEVNKNLHTFILQNPRITLDEVRSLAANRQVTPDLLNTIAANKDWGNNANIVTALVRNPKTPQSTAAKLIDKVPLPEVRRLAKANDVPRAVVSAARKRLEGGEMIWLIKFAMCTMMPRTESLPGIADTDVDAFLRKLRAETITLYWLGLVLGAVMFALTPLFTIGVPLPAFALPKKLLDRHTERVLSHPLYLVRQGVFLIRVSAGLCWGADEKVRAKFALAPYPTDPGTFRQSGPVQIARAHSSPSSES